MMRALRSAALLLGLVWLFAFFGLVDLAGIVDFGPDEMNLIHLSISWGSLVTYFIVIPLFGVALRPTSLSDAIGVMVITFGSLALGAVISGAVAGDGGPLLLALPLLLTLAVVTCLGIPRSRWRTRLGMPRLVPRWRLVALAVVGVALWLPYVLHAARAIDTLPDDVTIGLNHWPVQVSAGIAVMLACVVAAIVPGHRRLPIVAASLCSVSIGACMVANLGADTATESGPWGIGCVLWGTVLALSSTTPVERPHQSHSTDERRAGARPAVPSMPARGV